MLMLKDATQNEIILFLETCECTYVHMYVRMGDEDEFCL